MNIGPDDLQFEAKGAAADSAKNSTGPVESLLPDATPDPELEQALRQALQPLAAPAGFAERVAARARAGATPATLAIASPMPSPDEESSSRGKVLHWPQSRLWITGAVAAALLAGVFEGGMAFHHMREQERRVMEATRQFQTTERVTVRALAQAREQLERAGVPLNPD